MYRAAVLALALFVPSVATAQQPCTTDASRVVNELYRHMLERQADPGSSHWVQQLENGRMTVRDVVRGITTSPEYTQRFVYTESGEGMPYERSVARLYRHILGRQPDAEGQRAFAQLAQRSGANAVIDRILASNEYNERFGDWGAPGSGGMRYCAPNSAASRSTGTSGTGTSGTTAARRFRGMDRNNDGVITRNEWRGSNRSFEVHDWNGDGILSGDELNASAFRAGSTLEDEDFDRRDRFESIDANSNGRIELNEWHGSVAAFRQLDTNDDNRITFAEYNRGVADNSATGTSGDEIRVDARNRWTDTGVDVRAGDMITFDADGTIRMSADQNDVAAPGGAVGGRRANEAPFPRQSAGALIGRVNGRTFFIGDRRQVRMPTAGRLYLGVNDDYLEDNSGDYQVRITVQ
jgi:phycobilisome linker polypeptide/uncharacterized protein DUF4214/EF hand domain-containing protein